jgi:predicted nucleotidyltransferase
MVTKSAVNREIQGFLEALEAAGFRVEKAYLFGSMYKGNPHAYSDIDLAVWSPDFSDNYFETMEKTAHLKRLHKRIELHPFQLKDTADNNPFVGVIESTGKKIKMGEDALI